MKIAIIEDNPEFIVVVKSILDMDEVVSFTDVKDFKDDGFDLVLTDLRLKGSYTYETLDSLRPLTKAPIVVLSGLINPHLPGSEVLGFFQAGATEVYAKEVINDPGFRSGLKDIMERSIAGEYKSKSIP